MRGVLHLCACALLLVLVTLPSTQGQVTDTRCNFYRTLPLPATCTSNCGTGFGACTRAGTICCPFGATGRCSYCVAAPATCPTITSVSNGNVFETTVNDQRRLTFSCNAGFRLVGSSILTCTGTVWSGAFPTCESTVSTSCPVLSINNAILSTNAVFNGVIVSVLCQGGTTLSGGADRTTITCNQGIWSQNPLPACTAAAGDCQPLTITNGLISTQSVFPGAVVNVLCRTGFTLGTQAARITCLNLLWSPAIPVCNRIAAPTCPSITIPNGFLSNQNVAEGTQVNVVCEQGFTLGAQSSVIRCSSGNWRPAVPTCQRASCPALVIPNAVFSPTTTTVNTQVQVQCNPAYQIVGASVITCSLQGSWTPAIPVCRRAFCTALTAPANGVIAFTGDNAVNSQTGFACNRGFTLVGSSRRTCQQNLVWDGVAPVCNRDITCSIPGPPANGQRSVSGDGAVGTAVSFTCNAGYRLQGAAVIRCQQNGGYDQAVPVCIRVVTCQIPGPPANGQRSVTGDGAPGTVIAFTCNQGYVLQGAGVLRCQTNGAYDQAVPTCARAFCTEIQNPSNGQKNVTGNIAPGQAVQFACAAGFQLEGAPVLVCLTNGAYDRPAPICRRVAQCPLLQQQANRQDSYSSNRVVNSFVQFTCASGYFLDGSSSLRCQSNGAWDGNPPVCRGLACPAVPGISNGQALSSDTRVNSQVNYRCNSGYVLSFNEPLRCVQAAPNQQPRWDRNPPVCNVAACGPPPGTENGSPINPNDRALNSQVRYQCAAGFQLSANTVLTCVVQSNGQLNWDRAPPSCIRASCSAPPSIANGGPSTNGNFVNAVATYTCNSGYTLVGNDRLVCRNFGQGQFPRWDGTPPSCTVRDCGPLPNLANAAPWPPSLSRAVGASHSVPCDPGHTPSRVTATCSSGGRWEYSQGCTAVRCQSVGAPRFGQISQSDNTVGSTVQVTCSPGYQISGPSLLTCRITGNGAIYTPNVPSCNPITCMALMSPRFGRVDVQGPRNPNTVARYTCDNGYTLRGASEVTCQSNGMWSRNPPTCEPVDCGNNLPNFANAIRRNPNDVTNTLFGSSLDLPCSTGFMPDAITVFCTNRATWESVGRCVAAPQCPGVHSPNSGGMNVNGITLSFRCNPGFERQGPMNITCRNGVWSSLPPVCIPIPGGCSPPPTPVNGLIPRLISGNEGSVNAVYRFACFPGYTLVGERDLRCQGNGGFNGLVPTCRRTARCEQQFRDPAFGRVVYTTDNLGRPQARFECTNGYQLSCTRTASRPSCDTLLCSDNQWNGAAPICEPVPPQQCQALSIPGVDISYTRNNNGQLVATFTCVNPQLVADPPTATCQANRWTNAQPTCRPRVTATCQALNIRNGRVDYFEGSTQVGTQNGQVRPNTLARIFCSPQAVLNGDTQLTCQSNGVWTGTVPTECIAGQPTDQCPVIQQVNNGEYQYSANRATARLVCDNGYTPNGVTDFTCRPNRAWDPTPNTQCVGASTDNICGVISLDTNVFDVGYSNQGRLGSVATFSCRDGNLSPEPATATCQANNAWTNSQPQCRPRGVVTCQAFSVSSATATFTDGNNNPVGPNVGRVNVGTRAIIQCDGVLNGNSNLLCQPNGQWDGTPPSECTPRVAGCNVFAVGNGRTQYLQGAQTINPAVGSSVQVGITVRVECDGGYTRQGDEILTCRNNGQWNGNQNIPRCVRTPTQATCLSFGVSGATVRYFQGNNPIQPNLGVDGVSSGTRVNVICNSGLALSGSADRECRNGQWTGNQPTCTGPPPTGANCQALIIQNGRAQYTNFGSPGSRATVICDNGDGSESICTGGSWLPTPNTCAQRP